MRSGGQLDSLEVRREDLVGEISSALHALRLHVRLEPHGEACRCQSCAVPWVADQAACPSLSPAALDKAGPGP